MDSADERMAPSDECVEGIPAAGTRDRCADGSRISEDDRNAERICSAGVEDTEQRRPWTWVRSRISERRGLIWCCLQ